MVGRTLLIVMAAACAAWAQTGRAAQVPEVAARARAVLERHCHACHGRDGSAEAGFGHVLDRERLVASGLVEPGDPEASLILERMTDARSPMPPREDLEGEPITIRPDEAEISAVREWIASGASGFTAEQAERPFIRTSEVFAAVVADLERAPASDRPFRRYFSLAHLHDAGRSDDELLAVRRALSKLVNSLSWGRRIVVPRPLGPADVVLGIDLRDYGWTAATWDLLVAANGYDATLPAAQAVQAARLAGTAGSPVLRADWFVKAASRPPLYEEILGLPGNAALLEVALLGSTAAALADRDPSRVKRAGFNGSGVSGNNRLIERHEIPAGRRWDAKAAVWEQPAAYWKSYDFASNNGRQNLFAFPLGPGPAEDQFAHDGGEIIFNLPNGLQAYMLVDRQDGRINPGPIGIVADRRRNAVSVEVINGVSCMSCHAAGMIPKDDEVRSHVLAAVRDAFSRDEIVRAMTLYPERDVFAAAITADRDRFLAALQQAGAAGGATEPITACVNLFDKELDIRLAAAELGLREERFRQRLNESRGLVRRIFGPLLTGGTVKRDVMDRHFTDLAAAVGRAE